MSSSSLPSNATFRIAILVTGSFHRFVFQSSIEQFLLPLTQQGHHVDYYLSLSLTKSPAYRSNQNYMNYQVNDPLFDEYIHQKDNVTLVDATRMKERIHTLIQQLLQMAGVHLQYMTFQDTYDSMDTHSKVIERRQQARQWYPDDDDPDVRFPVWDIRNAAVQRRTANANRNMLHLFYHIQHLYQQLLSYEANHNEHSTTYDYVFFLRDDTMWIQHFDFRALMEDRPITANGRSSSSSSFKVELFIPSCDARVPSMHPMEINDHIMIFKRDRADIYGNYWDELFRSDMDACAQRLDEELRYGRRLPLLSTAGTISSIHDSAVPVPLRGCNSEMILRYVLEQHNVTIRTVGQGKIPFERMVFVKHPVTLQVHPCFHYFCQSHVDPLIIPPDNTGLGMCSELNLGSATAAV